MVASGPGTSLSSGSGTHDYTLAEAGDERAGHFEQAKFGENRYDLLPLFADVSNAVEGANPGHVTFYTHGLPFRDPNALTRWLGRRGDDLRDGVNWVKKKASDLDDWLWDPNNPLGTVVLVAGLFNPVTAPLVISYGVAKFGGIGFDRWGLDKQVAANNGWESPTLVGTLADVYGEAGAAFAEGLGDGGVIVINNLGKTFSLSIWSPWEEKKQGIIKEYGVIGEWSDLSAMIGSEALFLAVTRGGGAQLKAASWVARSAKLTGWVDRGVKALTIWTAGDTLYRYGDWSQSWGSNPLAVSPQAAGYLKDIGATVKVLAAASLVYPMLPGLDVRF